MKRLLKNKTFWIGAASGLVVGPMVLGRIAPNLKARLPNGT